MDRDLEAKTRTMAGWKSYITNIPNPTPQFVIGGYHQLLAHRKELPHCPSTTYRPPIYHDKRESIGGPPQRSCSPPP